MGSERNFRSHYYEKVGFRGVEEKRSLDILLAERPVDIEKIQSFALRFPLPGIYRLQVWQLLLGVLPTCSSSTEFCWEQRCEQYRECERVLTLTRRIQPGSSPATRATLVWLLETNRLKYDRASQLSDPACSTFAALLSSLAELAPDPETSYWVASRLYSVLEAGLGSGAGLTECLTRLLGEAESSLLSHCQAAGLLGGPALALCGRGCGGLLSPALLARLWDKLAAGSTRILAYTLATALIHCRAEVMAAESSDEMLAVLTSMKEERQETVLAAALDWWEGDCCPLDTRPEPHPAPATQQ